MSIISMIRRALHSQSTVPVEPELTREQRWARVSSEEAGIPQQPKPLSRREARATIDDLYLMGEDPHIDLIDAAAGRKRDADPLRGLHHLYYID